MKILFLTKYDRLAANTRYRCLQYIPYLESQGIQCFVSPLLDDEYLKFKFSSGRFKLSKVASAYWNRFRLLRGLRHYDMVVLHYELFPYFPSFIEAILSFLRINYVYDFDDAIFHQYDSNPNLILRYFLKNKILNVIRNSKEVLAGNRYLADYAKRASNQISIVPTVVDPVRYQPSCMTGRDPRESYAKKPFTIGWIGSPSTVAYVKEKASALREFCRRHDAQLVLVGSGEIEIEGVPTLIHDWSEENELEELSKFDVGIMPLTDDPWSRGKCGFKLIQYMACGLPVVASPVGVNRDLVEHEQSGYLATTDEEWVDALEKLYYHPEKRQQMGRVGQLKVEHEYSLSVYAPKVAKIIRAAAKRKKIVHLISSLSAGGTEMMLYKLLSGMNNEKYENIVVSMTDGGDEMVGSRIKKMGIPVYTLKMKSGVPDLVGGFKLLLLLRQERPDILQTWLYHSDLLGALVAKLAGVRFLVWNIRCSYLDLRQYSRLTSLSVRLLAKLSKIPNAVLVNSRAGLEYHKNLGYHPRRWELVPNGFDIQQFRPNQEWREEQRKRHGIPLDVPVIGMVARFDPMKDYKTFLQAASELLELHPKVHFVLVGRGVSRDNAFIMSLVNNTGYPANFHLLSEQSDIPRILAMFDIFSLCSLGEGFPNVIGEAMACGVPCVVTKAGDSGNIVGDTGFVVPMGDSHALSRAWNQVLSMPAEERVALGKRSRDKIEQEFTLPVIVGQYERVYREMIMSEQKISNLSLRWLNHHRVEA